MRGTFGILLMGNIFHHKLLRLNLVLMMMKHAYGK